MLTILLAIRRVLEKVTDTKIDKNEKIPIENISQIRMGTTGYYIICFFIYYYYYCFFVNTVVLFTFYNYNIIFRFILNGKMTKNFFKLI